MRDQGRQGGGHAAGHAGAGDADDDASVELGRELRRASARVVGAAGRALQRLGPHRPRRREQEALAEAHVVVEQIDHHVLAFDALGDQVDAGARQQIGEVVGMDVALRAGGLVEQQLGRHLQEAERAVGQLLRLHAQVGDVIHGEAEAALGQRRQAFVLDRPEGAIGALREFEHQRGRRARDWRP